jgi:hypothetical protein
MGIATQPLLDSQAPDMVEVEDDKDFCQPEPNGVPTPSNLDLKLRMPTCSVTTSLLPQCEDHDQTCVIYNVAESKIRIEVSLSLFLFHFSLYKQSRIYLQNSYTLV